MTEQMLNAVRSASDAAGDTQALLRSLTIDRDAARILASNMLCDCGVVSTSPRHHSATCGYTTRLRAATREATVNLLEDEDVAGVSIPAMKLLPSGEAYEAAHRDAEAHSPYEADTMNFGHRDAEGDHAATLERPDRFEQV